MCLSSRVLLGFFGALLCHCPFAFLVFDFFVIRDHLFNFFGAHLLRIDNGFTRTTASTEADKGDREQYHPGSYLLHGECLSLFIRGY